MITTEQILEICNRLSADSREEAILRAAEKNFHAANHWNAHADGVDEVIEEIKKLQSEEVVRAP